MKIIFPFTPTWKQIIPGFWRSTTSRPISAPRLPIPVNPATGEIPEGIEAQAEQVLNNVKNLLAAAGASMEQVVKTTVFIQNMDDFGKVNEIYAKYFEGACPARSCVEVSKLPKGVLMEMEAIAAK